MIITEDSKSYELRKLEEHFQRMDEFYRKRAALVHPFNQHILDIVQEAGDEPIRITSVANRFARETGHYHKSRAQREDLKKHAFRIMGELIKGFRLERYRRKWAKWTPPDNPRRRAFEERVEETLKNLPKPQIG